MTEEPTEPLAVVRRRLNWGVIGGASRNAGAPGYAALIAALRQSASARLLAHMDETDAKRSERAYDSAEALLDDSDVECVYLAPPVGLEREWVLRAAEAGKHILCAPPIALDLTELDEMEDACAAAGVALMEAMTPLFHPRLDRLRDLLSQRVAGDPTHLTVEFTVSAPLDSYGRALAAPGANALLDLGGCCVAIVCALLGGGPEMVAASAQYGSTGAEIDLEAFLEFSAGVSAQMICSLISAGASEWLAIGGESGAISLPHPAFTAGPGDLAPICVHPTGAPELEVLPGPPADPCQLMIEAFSKAILHGEPAPYPLSESRATLRILEALSISARAGAAIQIEES
jgi:D-xylose 1-dehydrogenase (NADP+, D-xylono-1,5-lactone-forming)